MRISPANEARQRLHHLCANPSEAVWWDWYALLRLVQSARPELSRIGHGVGLDEDPVRLGHPPFFHPPAPTVAALKTHGPKEAPESIAFPAGSANAGASASKSHGHPVWIYSYHCGLWGPFGPLPLHLTEFAFRQSQQKDDALVAFCDVLHHRFLCYFFRAWADARKETSLDRPGAWEEHEEAVEADRQSARHISNRGERSWELYAGALIGLGLESLRNRDRVPDRAKLFYAGRLIHSPRNAEGLHAIIEDYFQVPAQVIPFVRRTVRLNPALCCRLGGDAAVGRLGVSAVLGESYEEYQQGFRIRLGPLSFEQFKQFLPVMDGFGEIHDWVRFYVGRETDPNPEAGLEAIWDLQLVLRAGEMPELKLGEGALLGWTAWLPSADPREDADDLVLLPQPNPLRPAAAAGRAIKSVTA